MTTLSEVKFEDRKLALQQKCKEDKWILYFVPQYCPTVSNNINKSGIYPTTTATVSEIFKDPPIVSYKRADLQKIFSFEPNTKISGYYTTWQARIQDFEMGGEFL